MGKGPSRKKKRTAAGKTETTPDHPVLAEDPFSESVIESLPGLFWVLDDKGRHVRWNKNLKSALGYAAEELADQHANFLVHPDYRSHVVKGIDRCFAEGHASIEYELVTKSGRRIPYSGSAKSVKLGKSMYMIGLAVDISARKKAEDAVRRALEEIVQLREQLHFELHLRSEDFRMLCGAIRLLCQLAETVFSASSDTAQTEALERTLGGLLEKAPAAQPNLHEVAI